MVGVVKQKKKATGELVEYKIEMGKVAVQPEPEPQPAPILMDIMG